MWFHGYGEPIDGETIDLPQPEWQPLLDLVPEAIDDFMWMFAVDLSDGRRVHAYKHWWTRQYLHLDGDGSTFVYTQSGRYQEVDPDWLLEIVLRPHPEATYAPWWRPPGAQPALPAEPPDA